MRYVVEVDGRDVLVEFTADGMTVDGDPVSATLVPDGQPGIYRLFQGDISSVVEITRANGSWRVHVRGEHRDVTVVDERIKLLEALTGAGGAGGGETIKAPMPGMVLRLEVEEGQVISAGDAVVVLEAMKMENEIRAGRDGVVRSVAVAAGTAVEKGAVMVEIDPPADSGAS